MNNFQKSIWPINGILISTTKPGQSGPGIDGNEAVQHTSQIFRIKA